MNSEPTLTKAIILSDMAIREQGTGKSTLIGTFGAFNIPQFPAQVAPFYATALIANVGPEVREMDVTARIENPQNGVVLASTAAKVAFSRPPARNEVTEISIPLFNFGFPAAGLYKIVILVNNEKIGERDLPVNDIRANIP
jgi:hypothetical protein